MNLLQLCPFCGAGETSIYENGKMWTGMKYSDPISISIRHWCEPIIGQPSRMIERVGKDLDSAIAAWNMRSQSTLFVARHRETGLYQRKVGAHFIRFGCREWIKFKNPSYSEIREEIESLRVCHEKDGVKVWTDDINDCEIWDLHAIQNYLQYFPELEIISFNIDTGDIV